MSFAAPLMAPRRLVYGWQDRAMVVLFGAMIQNAQVLSVHC